MTEEIQVKKGHPKGLFLLFTTEMWERFSYYGMRAILTLYITKALLYDKAFASTLYGSYTSLVYLTPLLGGYIADRYWGNRKSIIFGGILMAIGQFFMFFSGLSYTDTGLATNSMYIGLGFLIFGNGFFKPNISTMVGDLYQPGDKRLDAAFSIFYMGINLGAFLGNSICSIFGEQVDEKGLIIKESFKYGFLFAGIGMLLGLILFIMLKNKYIVTPEGEAIGGKPVPVKNELESEIKKSSSFNLSNLLFWIGLEVVLMIGVFKGLFGFDWIGSFVFATTIVAPASIIADKSLTKPEKQRIFAIYIVAFFVIAFWAAFEQAGSSLTFFAEEQVDRVVGGITIPASLMQVFNAVSIVIFAPLFAVLWTELGKRKLEPSSPMKQVFGLVLLGLGYLLIAFVVKDLDPNLKVSVLWLIGLYLLHTFGELCLSPIGLSMVVKLAPARLASLLMGVWFLSTATANKFAGDLGAFYPETIKKEASIEIKDNSTKIGTLNLMLPKLAQDSASLRGYDNNLGTVVIDKGPKVEEVKLSFTDNFIQNIVGAKKEEYPVTVTTLNMESTKSTIEPYLDKMVKSGTTGKILFKLINNNDKMLYSIRTHPDKKDVLMCDVWNLNPTKPSLFGNQINTLYDFFIIFVVMSFVAAGLLLICVPMLRKMSHGLL